ncbi:transcription termination factor 4, mitochondrial isoform X3 [Artibeus jamaicensis]|uniref:transcription termination factor 4, mitochondrial isoform X3 n=1 Tax=Artibeus jamaicensis TaxID=9417 RepID=UPI00235B0672|nr:transcription termination factor 4, mitochondrial isoform X3 [Artibeus jamaicensis]
MAALGRRVLDWHRLVPLTWARVAAQTPRLGEQRRAPALLLCKLTTASSGGGLGGLSHVESGKHVQESECKMSLRWCPLEKQRAPVDGASLEQEEVISFLLDMGFSGVHAHELLSIRPGTPHQQLLDIVSELILLGVNPEPVYVALKKSPQLLKLPVMHVKKRADYLRKLGLGEGRLKKVLHCCPEVFTRRHQDLDGVVRVLREKCLFTAQQVTEILHRCPHVLREDPGELEYKFQLASADERCLGVACLMSRFTCHVHLPLEVLKRPGCQSHGAPSSTCLTAPLGHSSSPPVFPVSWSLVKGPPRVQCHVLASLLSMEAIYLQHVRRCEVQHRCVCPS